jgi:hypothetical protein
MRRYRLGRLGKVENGVACLVAFWDREWYPARQLVRGGLMEEGPRWWRWQRSNGLSLAVDQAA